MAQHGRGDQEGALGGQAGWRGADAHGRGGGAGPVGRCGQEGGDRRELGGVGGGWCRGGSGGRGVCSGGVGVGVFEEVVGERRGRREQGRRVVEGRRVWCLRGRGGGGGRSREGRAVEVVAVEAEVGGAEVVLVVLVAVETAPEVRRGGGGRLRGGRCGGLGGHGGGCRRGDADADVQGVVVDLRLLEHGGDVGEGLCCVSVQGRDAEGGEDQRSGADVGKRRRRRRRRHTLHRTKNKHAEKNGGSGIPAPGGGRKDAGHRRRPQEEIGPNASRPRRWQHRSCAAR